MMRREEVQSFCQFLVRNRLIAPERMGAVLSAFDRGVLSGNKLAILHSNGADARSGAIVIVQELVTNMYWLKPNLAEPIKIAALWQSNPDLSLTDSQWTQALSGEVASPPRISNPKSDTIVATKARPSQPPAALPPAARPMSAEPKLVRFGDLYVPAKIGDFNIIKPLGEGGMGAVFLASNQHTGLRVALKVMIEDLPGKAPQQVDEDKVRELRERFRREAIACMQLASPHIVRGFHLGEDDGILYLVMELIAGVDLGKYVQTLPKDDTTIVLRLVRDAARGVGVFHAKRFIHRDVKPGNIMVDAAGCPKVIDSGLVRSLNGDDVAPAQLTTSQSADANLTNDQMIGTPAFMAPEQAMSQPVGPQADVFSFGKVLVFLLIGRHVHEAKGTIGLMNQLMSGGPLPPHIWEGIRHRFPFGGMAKQVMAVATKALAFQPADRHKDANEFADAIDEVLVAQAKRKENEAAAQAQALEDERNAREEQQRINRKLFIGLGLACAFTVLLLLLSIFFAKARQEAEGRASAEARTAAEQKLRADVGKQFLDCQALMRGCKWVEAEEALLSLLAKDASYEAARYALAHVQFNLRKLECVDQWKWLIEHGSFSRRSEFAFYAIFYSQQLKPPTDDNPYRDFLGQIKDERYLALAQAELAFIKADREAVHGSHVASKDLFDRALKQVPAMPESDDLAWLALAVRGGIKWRMSQLATGPEQAMKRLEARLVLQQSIARNPDFPMTWYWLSDTLRGMGEHVAAIAAFERLECLMPNWAPPRYLKMEERMSLASAASSTDSPEEIARKVDEAMHVAIESVSVCDHLLSSPGIEARHRALAKVTKFHALCLKFSLYRRLRQPQQVERMRTEINQLGQELVESSDLLPDEVDSIRLNLQQIQSRQ